MDSLRQNALYLALNKFADVNAVPGADLDQRLMPVRIQLRPNVLAIQGHLGGPHVGTQRMERYLSLGEGMQALRELGARLAVFADDLAQVNPLRAGLLGDRFTLT